ncbi:MAG: hypothetical protein ACI9MC_003563 [Kiritimatiellia bacterium]|jgi:hypothetical protein
MSKGTRAGLDALFRQARRDSGRNRAHQVNDEDREVSGGDSPKVKTADDSSRLVLIETRDGRYRYTLDGEEVRVGDEIEVYVNGANGWLHGKFTWTGRERHAPSIKVDMRDPDDPESFVGTMDCTLPKHARARKA